MIFLTRALKFLAAGILLMLAAGCATMQRPQGRACALSHVAYAVGIGVDPLDREAKSNFQRMLTTSLQQRDAGLPSRAAPWQWLVVSGGGQWGAFGAGFLQGWTQTGDRPEFDVVTGVSTGALIAPYAFLGKGFDAALVRSYQIASEKELVSSRGWLSLFQANSVYNTAALGKRVLTQVRDLGMIPALARENASGRRLIIGVVNADDGIFYAVDLTGLAARSDIPLEAREACMADYMLASAGVPVAFSPTFIEGQMLMDGSARTGVFMADLTAVVQRYGARAVNIYVIKNGALKLRTDTVKNRIPAIALRSIDVILDQLGDAALRDIVQQPRLSGQTRFITADSVKCNAEDPEVLARMFVPRFMTCLLDEGQRIGRLGEARWFKSLTVATKTAGN